LFNISSAVTSLWFLLQELFSWATGQLIKCFLGISITMRVGTIVAIFLIAVVGLVLIKNTLEDMLRNFVLGVVLLVIAVYLGFIFGPIIVLQIMVLLGL